MVEDASFLFIAHSGAVSVSGILPFGRGYLYARNLVFLFRGGGILFAFFFDVPEQDCFFQYITVFYQYRSNSTSEVILLKEEPC